MNKILQKLITEAAQDYSDHNYIDEGVEVPAFIEGADFALKNQWISVEEALPEIKEHFMSEDVLCKYSDGSMGFDYLKENIFGQQWFEHECEESVVTHWMLIPQLKGGENE